MVTIAGGELFSALGEQLQPVKTLDKPVIGSRNVKTFGEEITVPYYLLDDKPRTSDKEMVAAYLDRVVTALIDRLGINKTSLLSNMGLFLGSSSIDYSLAWPIEQDMDPSFEMDLKSERVGGGYYADALMRRFGWEGPSLTYNTACTSSANAVMDAAAMIEGGLIDHALVIGLELYSPTTLEGFVMMQLYSSDAIRPFDQARNGIVLGEAISAVLLCRDDSQIALSSSWRYLGGKSNCETYSVTGANPTGEGIAQVMRDALQNARTPAETITVIKAHGTASALNDEAEMRGMEQVFDTIPPYLSLKPYIGHTLGGCGTAEMILMMRCIDAGFIPASANFETIDRSFSTEPITKPISLDSGRIILNYFGFGGNNTSFIIEKEMR